jgi:hypothetical protein
MYFFISTAYLHVSSPPEETSRVFPLLFFFMLKKIIFVAIANRLYIYHKKPMPLNFSILFIAALVPLMDCLNGNQANTFLLMPDSGL